MGAGSRTQTEIPLLIRSVPALFLVVVGCAGAQSSPSNVFDAYMEAYAEGDAPRVWELSSTEARVDGRRWQQTMIEMLEHEDPLQGVKLKGLFGEAVERVPNMGDREFFEWALLAIRERLGARWVEAAVSQWVKISVARRGPGHAIVVYREGGGKMAQLPVRKVGELWYVMQSPFPVEPRPEATPRTDPPAP